MVKAVAARDRFPRAEDRREVETLFRRAQEKFSKMAESDWKIA